MISDNINTTRFQEDLEDLIDRSPDDFNHMLETLINLTSVLQREQHLGARHYQRAEGRVDYANGYKKKRLNTRVGPIDLRIPQVRNSDFYPSCIDKGMRSERALKISLAEMYVQGVSTRKVKKITEELCGTHSYISITCIEFNPQIVTPQRPI